MTEKENLHKKLMEKFVKIGQGKEKERVLKLIDAIYEDEWTPNSVELIFNKTAWKIFKKELKQKIQGK